ncbi:hypothetical protein BGW41_003657 [Actinomortierella wolfii]|nr:hypothetical protein BGW41_003657 [Actinomortierella wolfii]
MQQPRLITPIELPELASIIVSYLGYRDKLACLLVCRQWHRVFSGHVFGEQVLRPFDATDPARLRLVGQYIRDLIAYFALGNMDLGVVATHCPTLRTLDMEIDEKASDIKVEHFMKHMQVYNLILRVRPGWNLYRRFASIVHLKSLRSLEIRQFEGCSSAPYISPKRVINILHALPSLSSITLNIQLICDIHYQEPLHPPQETLTPVERSKLTPPPIRFLHNPKHFFRTLAMNSDGDSLKNPTKPETNDTSGQYTPDQLRELQKPVDLTIAAPHLTKLCLMSQSTTSFATLAKDLFPLMPNLKDLALDFGCRLDISCCGLEAVIPNCRYLEFLTLRNIDCRPQLLGLMPKDRSDAQDVVRAFFTDLPSTLRELTLERIHVENDKHETHGICDLLARVPRKTYTLLRKLALDSLVQKQTTIHYILVACQSLRELRLAEVFTPKHQSLYLPEMMPLRPENLISYYTKEQVDARSDHFVGSMLETWPCMWTLESVDLREYPIVDEEAMAAWLSRLEVMPRLTKLAMSVEQVRLLLKARRHHYLGISYDNGTSKAQLRHVWKFTLTTKKLYERPRWRYDGTLEKEELEELLEMTPRIRSLRYTGTGYPIQEEAARWLETHRPGLQVLHVLQ